MPIETTRKELDPWSDFALVNVRLGIELGSSEAATLLTLSHLSSVGRITADSLPFFLVPLLCENVYKPLVLCQKSPLGHYP